jgi:hypothetical protein
LDGHVTGEWVRVSAYAQGHRVSANGRDAYCGTTLVYTEEWWEGVQEWAINHSGYKNRAKGPGKWSPTEFFIARDRRKGSQCVICKKGVDLMADEVEELPKVDKLVVLGDTRPFTDPTPADALQRQRFLSKVSWMARELGAQVLGEGDSLAA